MLAELDLRELAEMTAPERAFLSVYLAGPRSLGDLDRTFQRIRRVLRAGGAEEKDEREHFDRNVRAVREHFDRHGPPSGPLCILACWVLDFFRAIPLPAAVPDGVWVDSSPYIRPLAELQDEYENVAVVVADNRRARIFLVSSAVAGDEQVVRGNVKNHVKKGGWSQQRYERRRDKQLLLYAREIVQALRRLDRQEEFRRVVMVGGKEILRIVHENLPRGLQNKVAEKAVDLGRGDGAVNQDILEVFFEQERASERDLWERIRTEYLRGGLGAVGLEEVLSAARRGRVERVIVHRDFRPEGRRCRACEHLTAEPVEACPACGSTSVFAVDAVNEIVEMLKLTGAEADFADEIDTLAQAGHIAALLRY